MVETIFRKIIDKEIPADIIHEDELCLAFRDINPVAPLHVLIIPKKTIATTNDIKPQDKELIGHLHVIAASIAKQNGYAQKGYRLVWNCNEDGGQTVSHIHMHLLAGKTMGWPPFADTKKQR